MAIVRVLRAFRGLPCGVYADVTGCALDDGISDGALDPKAEKPADAEAHKLESEPAAKPAKKHK